MPRPNSRPIDFPPPLEENSVGTPGVEVAPTGMTNFYRCMELLIRKQQDKMLNLETQLYGFDCCIWNPMFRETQYDEEAQDFSYNITPDIEGRFLISGLIQYLSFGAKDQWSGGGNQAIILHYPQPSLLDLHEDAKIIVHDVDRQHSFKTKFLRKIVLQFTELRKEYQLIPYN